MKETKKNNILLRGANESFRQFLQIFFQEQLCLITTALQFYSKLLFLKNSESWKL